MSLEADILNKYRNVAVVGASSNPERPSHRVVSYLMKHGYHVMPVNPNEQKILGKTGYSNLSSISKARRHPDSDLFDLLLQIFRFLLCLRRAENLLTSAVKGSRNSECNQSR